MFDTNKIPYNQETGQYICICQCGSDKDADYICAKYLGISRQLDITGNIYTRGSAVIISASNQKAVSNIASYINANYFMPPLDVYVFYGSSQKGLDSRWCVGFNFPQTQVTQIIDWLNTQIRFANADKDPMSWHDKNGNSYSIVMLIGIMDERLTAGTTELFNKRVSLCLDAISNATFRQLNLIPI